MSPLHIEPFGSMLYHLGRHMLYKTLKIFNERKTQKKINSGLGVGSMSTEAIEAVFRYAHFHRKELMLIASKIKLIGMVAMLIIGQQKNIWDMLFR